MAENKKSFLLYTDVHFTVKKLTDEQAGKLFKHILSYVNDENPIMNDIIIDLVFEPIKQSLKRDLKRYEEIIEKRVNAGRLGGIESGKIRISKTKQTKQMLKNRSKTKQTQANEAVNVSGSVIGIDSDIGKEKEEKNKYSEFVFMLESEYQKLIDEHGDSLTKKFIEKLNNYKGSSGKKYKSDYLAILNWVVKEVTNEVKPQSGLNPKMSTKYLKDEPVR